MRIIVLLLFVVLAGCAKNKPAEVVEEVSSDDKRMLLSSLYLTKCSLSTDDFSKIAANFDSQYVRNIGNDSYIDQTSGAVVTLRKDMCAVQIPGKDTPKLASSLNRLLTVSGGDLSMAFSNGHYNGTYTKNGAAFNVAVKQHFQEFYYMSVIMRRIQEQ